MIETLWCGSLTYSDGLAAQEKALARVTGSHAGTILGLEHSSVITLGKRGIADDDLNFPETEIEALGVQIFKSERGGQATLHSPGQLVIYPCLSLPKLGLGVREYVEFLQAVTCETLAAYGIPAHVAADEPGVYTDSGKIAYFGVKVSRGLVSHGVAINNRNDLDLFRLIRSCGKPNDTFDSLQNRGVTLSSKELFQAWAARFIGRFA